MEPMPDRTQERLKNLRNGLLRLHKSLLDSERAVYERDVERITSAGQDRKSTRLNSSHLVISYAVFCLKKKKIHVPTPPCQLRLTRTPLLWSRPNTYCSYPTLSTYELHWQYWYLSTRPSSCYCAVVRSY